MSTVQPRVALVKCSDYDEARVAAAVGEAVAKLGGIREFVKPGQRVFVKVNLLTPKKIEQAVTTHPAVVKAVVRQLHAAGCTAIIGDSPGGPYTPRLLARAYRTAGLEQVAQETGAVLNFDTRPYELPHPKGKILKRITVAKPIAEADTIITIPKLKTHGLTALTGAVKILFGAIPGLLKMEYHLKMPAVQDFSDMLVDILTLLRPQLTIMDGIVGMEGEGPSAGRPKTVGAVLASADSLACDVVAAALVGMKPEHVTTTRAAMARGLTSGNVADVEVLGRSLQEMALDDFEPAVKGFMGDRVPKPLYRFGERLLRPKPVVREQHCTGCGTCASVCPPRAIVMAGDYPQTDYKACIRCFCCQELCPQSAITIWRPWVARRLFGT